MTASGSATKARAPDYAKQQGRPVDEILTEFREHGITILTSMILGFDYQTPEVVAQELDGLMKLKPSLAQFLIYGPVPGTPFNDRVMKENCFRTNTEGPGAVLPPRGRFHHHDETPDALARSRSRICSGGVFEQDFQRLGPSIFRFVEARLLGYRKLKNSPNPLLREKAESYARELRNAYPIFLAGRLFGPNDKVRNWIGDLEQRVYAELGRPSLRERAVSLLAVGGAMWAGLTLKMNLFQHPKLRRTEYRTPSHGWSEFDLWEEIHRKVKIPNLSIQVELQHARQQVWMRLEGALSSADAEKLAQRIQDSLTRSKNKLVLDLKKLHWDKVEDLRP